MATSVALSKRKEAGPHGVDEGNRQLDREMLAAGDDWLIKVRREGKCEPT